MAVSGNNLSDEIKRQLRPGLFDTSTEKLLGEKPMNLIHAVPTDALIAELTRRKRIRILENSTIFFNTMAQDNDGYMHSIEMDMVRGFARELNNKLYIAHEDTALAKDEHGRPTKTTRKASLMVLIPEGVDDD